MKHPERTTVTHFFAPAWRNPAVEVITWAKGDCWVVDYLRWLFAVTSKTPVVTADVMYFRLDRIFDNWCSDAAPLLPEATSKQIDTVAENYVYAGPFFVLNMADGNPVIVETNERQMEDSPAYKPANVFNSVDRWITKKPGEKAEMSEEQRQLINDRLLGISYSQSLDVVAREIGTSKDLAWDAHWRLDSARDRLNWPASSATTKSSASWNGSTGNAEVAGFRGQPRRVLR